MRSDEGVVVCKQQMHGLTANRSSWQICIAGESILSICIIAINKQQAIDYKNEWRISVQAKPYGFGTKMRTASPFPHTHTRTNTWPQ